MGEGDNPEKPKIHKAILMWLAGQKTARHPTWVVKNSLASVKRFSDSLGSFHLHSKWHKAEFNKSLLLSWRHCGVFCYIKYNDKRGCRFCLLARGLWVQRFCPLANRNCCIFQWQKNLNTNIWGYTPLTQSPKIQASSHIRNFFMKYIK